MYFFPGPFRKRLADAANVVQIVRLATAIGGWMHLVQQLVERDSPR
jgi:hypothetical protein